MQEQLRAEQKCELVRLLVKYLEMLDLDLALEYANLGRLQDYAQNTTRPRAFAQVVSKCSTDHRIIDLVEAVLAYLDEADHPIRDWLRDSLDRLKLRVRMVPGDPVEVSDEVSGHPFEVPPNMPYLIDRDDHIDEFNKQLKAIIEARQRQAMVVVIHGNPEGGHSQLVERLLHPGEGLKAANVRPPRHFEMHKPVHEVDRKDRLAERLCSKLNQSESRTPTLDVVFQELATQYDLVAIDVLVRTSELRPTDFGFVAEHLGFWEQIHLPQNLTVVYFIRIKVEPRNWYERLFARWWPGFDVEKHLPRPIAGKLLILPELAPVSREHVELWTGHPEAAPFLDRYRLRMEEADLAEICGGSKHHLEEMARRVRKWLERQRPHRHTEDLP